MNDYRLPIGTAQKLDMLRAAIGSQYVISFLSALEQYASEGILPDDIHPFVKALLDDVIPVNDIARKRSAAGKQGGSKPKANSKQTESKTEATDKQERKDEKKEKEIPPIPPKEREEKREKKDSYESTFDISNEISHYDSTAEAEIPVITFPLNDGSEFPITQAIFNQLAELYPAVDTMQTLRDIKGWCLGNPKNRKTKRGAMRFVHSWFSKQQDRGPKTAVSTKPRRPTPEEVYVLPAVNPWAITGGTL